MQGHSRRYRLGPILLAAGAFTVALTAGEFAARVLHLDERLLLPMLFFQAADLPVHRVSSDPVLHYELAPGARYHGDRDGHRYEVSIDDNGARFPAHRALKEPGVFRILCLGGSTVYGAAVDDDETIPAALERRLNAAPPPGRRYEAWNLGTSAYTLRQAAHLARIRLDVLDPDVVLVQIHNGGRRGFLMPRSGRAEDYPWPDILADSDLFEEQFESWLPRIIALRVLRRSALARACAAVLPGFCPSRACEFCDAMDRQEARALSQDAELRGVPVLYYSIPANGGRPKADDIFPGLAPRRFIDLYQPNREDVFYEVHPPPATLDEFASLLVDALQARGVLPPR